MLAPLMRAGLSRPAVAAATRCLPPPPAALAAAASALGRRAAHISTLTPTSVTVRPHARADSPRGGSAPRAAADAAPTADFGDLLLTPPLLAALEEHGLTQPTEIQVAAVPALLTDRSSDFLLASHTGSGKTLAYLLPIVQLLKEREELAGAGAKVKRPRALVLGPTRELTDQILQVAKRLSHHAKFRSAALNGGGEWGQQKAALERSVDLLVGTPQRVMQHADKSNLYYGDVDVVVLDEADTMFDRGFGPEVRAVLKAVRSKPEPARCVLVSATMSKQVRRLLEEDFPSIRTLETQTLHRGVAGARHAFLPTPPGANKLDLLVQVVEGEQRRGKKVMIFCNTLDSCRAADHHLRERSLPTACYHGDVPLEGRRAAIAAFSGAPEGRRDAAAAAAGSDDRAGAPWGGAWADDGEEERGQPLLVCTDLAARGLDIPGRVDHVVNFDFPLNPIDYLHRTGRTARAGAGGRITSLVGKGDRVLAARIEDALRRGLPLDSLSADRRVLPAHMRAKPETLQRKAAARKAEEHSRKGRRGAARLEPPGKQQLQQKGGGRGASGGRRSSGGSASGRGASGGRSSSDGSAGGRGASGGRSSSDGSAGGRGASGGRSSSGGSAGGRRQRSFSKFK